jgi:N-methylhydantoinase B
MESAIWSSQWAAKMLTPSASHNDHDPVTTEIIRNGLIGVTEEMKQNLIRTAHNHMIYEGFDFTTGLFDAQGNTCSIGIGLPMFIRGMSDTVKAKLKHYGAAGIHPGDILLTNDAYITGSHLNHLTFSAPIFDGEELLGFASCMAHWQDVGGVLNGVTTDIYSEGLQLPIVKIYRRGKLNEDILSLIRMNVRLPERSLGDFRAQVATVRTGERRFLSLVQKYGRQAVLNSVTAIMNQSEAAARACVREIPDGIYEAESFMDDDGVDLGCRIPIKVKVVVADDEMTIDLSNISDQVKGFYNSGETAGQSCAQLAFKCLTSPTELPINEGSFRSLKVVLPKGKVVSAVRPAPMRWWMTFPMTVVDTIFRALAAALPNKIIAGHHADLVGAMISGYRDDTGALFLATTGHTGGGWGAKHSEDGVNATIAINDGDTNNAPCEQTEAKHPIIIESYGLRQDSGGPGRHRGGLGTEKVVRVLTNVVINIQLDRVICKPWGLYGGLSGAGNEATIRHPGQDEQFFPNGKILACSLGSGGRYTLKAGGGGGYGSPLERAPANVLDDVRQGYVSAHSARHNYGVVLDEQTLGMDRELTASLRIQMKASGLPRDEPFRAVETQRNAERGDRLHLHSDKRQAELVSAVMTPRPCC